MAALKNQLALAPDQFTAWFKLYMGDQSSMQNISVVPKLRQSLVVLVTVFAFDHVVVFYR